MVKPDSDSRHKSDRERILIRHIFENTRDNLFVTGKAGTGKTTFVKSLISSSSKTIAIVAQSGLAALNIDGHTIHSFFQLNTGVHNPDADFSLPNFSIERRELFKHLDMIVIDEISMVRADLIDVIDATLRKTRCNDTPFGGVQMVFVGDLCQLPPVATKADKQLLKKYYGKGHLFYKAKVFEKTNFVTVELSHIYRQRDRRFASILNRIRLGEQTDADLTILNKRIINQQSLQDYPEITKLYARKIAVNKLNDEELVKLPGDTITITAKVDGDFDEEYYPTDYLLKLRPGALVMLTVNDSRRQFVNGTIATVLQIKNNLVWVKLPNGKKIPIKKHKWVRHDNVFDEASGKYVFARVGTFIQYPLRLAWALTIHKSQGLTYESVIVGIDGSFTTGQAYVALSRCRSLGSLYLLTKIENKSITVSKQLKEFYAGLSAKGYLSKLYQDYNLDKKGEKRSINTFISRADAVEKLKSLSAVISIEESSKRQLIPNYSIQQIIHVKPNSLKDLEGILGLTVETITKYGQKILEITHKGSDGVKKKSRIRFLDTIKSLDAKIYTYAKYHTLLMLRYHQSGKEVTKEFLLVNYLSSILSKDPTYIRRKLIDLKIIRPLYHGTDLRILKMGYKTRKQYHEACERILEKFISFVETKQNDPSLNPVLSARKDLLERIKDKDLKEQLSHALNVLAKKQDMDPLCQFDCISFCSRDVLAKEYAKDSYSFGQLGKTANALGKYLLEYNPEEVPVGTQIDKDIKRISDFAKEKRQPVIVKITYYSLSDLELPDGGYIPPEQMSSYMDSRRPMSDLSDVFLYRKKINLAQFQFEIVQTDSNSINLDTLAKTDPALYDEIINEVTEQSHKTIEE